MLLRDVSMKSGKKTEVALACFSCYEPTKYEDIDGRCDRLEPLCWININLSSQLT